VSVIKQQTSRPANCPIPADTGVRFLSTTRSGGAGWRVCRLGHLLLLAILASALRADEDVPKTLFLVTEADRIVAANADTGQFFELDMHAKEKVEHSHVANAVAVLITNQRFVAIGAFPGGWHSIRRQADEEFVSVEAAGYSALVVTSERILTFSGRNGSWSYRAR
jgi:hypothetical protein